MLAFTFPNNLQLINIEPTPEQSWALSLGKHENEKTLNLSTQGVSKS